MVQSVQPAAGTVGDQFYVTHCATADSVLNNPGYAVRAASAADPGALDAALHYPPYELPIDMWRDLPAAAAAPRRLARTEHPAGGAWVVHSAYLEKDSVGRDRSYLSHLLHLPAADPAAVLRSWGADGWATSYPAGAPKTLPGGARLPVGTLVSDAALTAFLGDSPAGPVELGPTVCPARWRGPAADRRALFARFLRAVLALADEGNEHRHRLYVHAEPGLTALLLYGAVRLLPARVSDRLTFSTFEPYHRNFRDDTLPEVVGTYLGAPDRGLDADLGTTRGVALDTFVPARSSPELRAAGAPPAGLDDLIDLAERGEWELLPAVRAAVGADVRGLPRAGAALARARGLVRVDAGVATIDELLVLQADRLGADELAARAAALWPKVKEAALARADVRAAFRDLIAGAERVRELWEEAVEAVLREDFRRWDARWAVLREVLGTDEARKLLNRLVGSDKNEARLAKVPTDGRAKLRAACADVGLPPPRALLVPVGLGELEPLLTARPEWAGYTAFALAADDALGWLAHLPPSTRAQMRARARAFLLAAPPAAVAAYVRAARPHLDADAGLLDAPFKPYSDGAARLMDTLLAAGALEPADWLSLCKSVGLTQDEWGAYLLEKDRLATLLVGLGGGGTGREVWAAYLDLLTPALVAPDLIAADPDTDPQAVHDWERTVHAHLRTAAERLTTGGVKLAPALPEGGVARLFAANALVRWADHPGTAERDGPDELAHACAAFGVDRLGLVRAAYRKGGFDRLDLPAQLSHLDPVVGLFRTAFPVDGEYRAARAAVTEWLKLSAACPPAARGYFQAHFVLACVPEGHYATLLAEQRHHAFDPLAESMIRQRLANPSRKAGPKYAPPARAAVEVVAEARPVDDEGEDAADPEAGVKRTGKSDRRGSKKAAAGPHRRAGNSSRLWLVAGVVLALALVVAAAFVVRSRRAPAPAPEPEIRATDPKK